MAESGKTDKIKALKESSFGAGVAGGSEVVFGYTRSFEWSADTHTTQHYALESEDATPVANTDGVLEVSGSHEWELNDGRELECIFGNLSDDGVSSYTLAIQQLLPTYSVSTMEDYNAGSPTFVDIETIKYSSVSISMSQGDDPVLVTGEWFGRKPADGTTFTPTSPSTLPFKWQDFYATFGGTEWELESLTIEINRAVTAQRFSKNASAGEKRLITDLVEGVAAITYNGVATIDRAVLEEIWGGSSGVADVRDDVEIVSKLANSTNTLDLTMTGARQVTIDRVLSKDQEVALVEFSGVALGLSGSGTY